MSFIDFLLSPESLKVILGAANVVLAFLKYREARRKRKAYDAN